MASTRRHGALGEADHAGGVVDGDRFAQFLAQPGGVAGRGEVQAGHDLQHGQSHMPWWLGAVGPGDAGAVQHER